MYIFKKSTTVTVTLSCVITETNLYLTVKRLRRGGGVQIDPPPCGFSKNVSSKERVKPCFFLTFNIILRHIFPEKFIEFPQVAQKIWRNSLSILPIFINFPRFIGFFDITLLQRNKWRQLIRDDVSIFSLST